MLAAATASVISAEDAEELFSQSSCFPLIVAYYAFDSFLFAFSLSFVCIWTPRYDSSCLFAEIKTKSICSGRFVSVLNQECAVNLKTTNVTSTVAPKTCNLIQSSR